MPMKTATTRIMMSFRTAVQADPWMPETMTYSVMAIVPIQMAAVDEIDPYDASETMIPSPVSWSTRYGTIATTPTTDTSTPMYGLRYLALKKSDCDTSPFSVPYRQITGSSQ